MFKKILDLLGLNKSDDVVLTRGEYELLVKNSRIIDNTGQQEKSFLNLRYGFYQDTYKNLTTGLNNLNAKKNIDKVLSEAAKEYTQLLYDKYGVRSTLEFIEGQFPKNYDRVQKIFKVEKLETRTGLKPQTLCLNFMVRSKAKPYLVIGNKPKGKITRDQRIKAKKQKWDKYTHL